MKGGPKTRTYSFSWQYRRLALSTLGRHMDVSSSSSLPFSSLTEGDFAFLCSGSRILLTHNGPLFTEVQGKVSTRNYVAGYTKKSLRTSRPKGLPKTAEGLIEKLCVELQLCVFEHLHPIDLYHLSRVCKFYRKFILDSRSLWKISFIRHPDLPRPPPGVLESDWAFMLYGPGICKFCSRFGALTDFAFLQRYCDQCMDKNYVTFYQYERRYGGLTNRLRLELSELLLYTYRPSGLYYHLYTRRKRYLLKDLRSMLRKLALMQILIDNGLPQLGDLVQQYKHTLRVHNAKRQNVAFNAGNWAAEIFQKCLHEYNNGRQAVKKRCEARLHSLGYSWMDADSSFQYAVSTLGEKCIVRLTRKGGYFRSYSVSLHFPSSILAIRTIKPLMERWAQRQQNRRIQGDRLNLLRKIYTDYIKSLSPEEWEDLPPPFLVLEIDDIKRFYVTPPLGERGDVLPGYVASFFPSLIEEFQRRQHNRMIELFTTIEPNETKLVVTKDSYQLAAFVVTCQGSVLIGWRDIRRHLRGCSSCKVDSAEITGAASVISAAGMDPAKTTVSEMDNLGGRFICGNCDPEFYRGRLSREVYTWMECIRHNAATHITTPRWLCLTPAATQFIRRQEPLYPPRQPFYRIWSCNHCAQHYECKAAWADVVAHVKRVHCVKAPVKGKDIRVTEQDEEGYHLRRPPFRWDVDVKYHCQRCPELPIVRIWNLDDLTRHLKHKHHVEEPIEGIDWTLVKLVDGHHSGLLWA